VRPFRAPARLTPAAALIAALAAALIAAAAVAHGAPPERVIVVFGDSLTAGAGVAADEAFPARLQERLRREGYAYRVVNAGVTGDTTAGGLRRLDWVLRAKPEVVVLALGANDGLRGLSVDRMKANLRAIVERLSGEGARVLLAGMRVPPNYGDDYARAYEQAFAEVARREKTPLMPFLLDGVAADPRLNQPDGSHPNAAGHQVIADRLWLHLKPLLAKRSE
jgi:acyl-CoA thioesterase I